MSGPEGASGAVSRLAALNHLLKLHNRLMVPFTHHLEKRHRITVNEFRVLMLIGQLEEAASHAIAAELGVNTMAVSRAVAALSARGLVAMTVDPASRRRKLLRLTAAGQALWGEMNPSSLKVADYLFAALGGQEMRAFDRCVRMLTERLEAEDAGGASVFLRETRPADNET